jgi:hypothetical protein
MVGFIYITENIINNKKYIGRKKYKRGWETYLGSSKLLKEDIIRYGISSFRRTILQECNTFEELVRAEIEWQELYKVKEDSNFYNLTYATEGFDTSGSRYTYDTQRKNLIWTADRKKKASDKWKDKNNNPNNLEHVRLARSKRLKQNTIFKDPEFQQAVSDRQSKPYKLEYNGEIHYFKNAREAVKVFGNAGISIKKIGIKKHNPFKGLKFLGYMDAH